MLKDIKKPLNDALNNVNTLLLKVEKYDFW